MRCIKVILVSSILVFIDYSFLEILYIYTYLDFCRGLL